MEYLLSTTGILEHAVTRWMLIIVAAALVLAPLLALALTAARVMTPATRADVLRRTRTWWVIAPLALGPILLCPLSAMLLITALALLCYREYARATGLFRHRLLSLIVALGIVALAAAAIDHWYGFFMAIQPLTMVLLAGAGVMPDQPKGYLQRVATAAVGFGLFGAGLMHLAYIANDANYRPVLCILLACTQLSDIAGYCVGKAIGRRKVFPNTSPSKTLGGHLGGLLIVAPLAAFLTHAIFPGSRVDTIVLLACLGVLIALGAQLGDLVLGSIKRDIGVKDLATILPGHGGFTDRCNSLLLVAPVAFHYLGYFVGFGLDRLPRVLF